jgi:hypothetical protein
MSGCDQCGAYDLDWWTKEKADGPDVRVILCEVCGWSEEEEVEDGRL